MLVLQQEMDTSDAVVEIWLPDGRVVEVKLVDVRNNRRCRMGYNAPPDIQVYRRGVADAIRRDRAAQPVGGVGVDAGGGR